MLELTSPADFPVDYPDVAVAIGKFDGIHLGHRQLIHELVEYCSEESLSPVVITFDRHPKALLDPDNCPSSLIGPNQKAELISSLGVQALLTLHFDETLANLSPEKFVEEYLASLGTRMVFVGEGFTFGAGGSGRADNLRTIGVKHGFRVREVPHLNLLDRKISSTDVRNVLDVGRVDVAATMLGRNHRVTGVVEHGRKLGRTLGFPTANISRAAEGYLPGDGVYAGYMIAGEMRYPAAHSVGTNDSVGEVPRLLESHVIGRDDLDLYGQVVTCEFVEQVRGWAKFDSLESLIKQISLDVVRAAEILGE